MRLLSALCGLLLALTACGGDVSGEEDRDPAQHNQADVDFATEMIKHHAEALAMVDLTVARDDLDPELLDLADSIRTEQALEIEQMTTWLNQWNEPIPETVRDHVNAPHDDGDDHGGTHDEGALAEIERAEDPGEFRRLWLEHMIAHHEGAVAMAEAELERGSYGEALELAESVKRSQQAEIEVMRQLLG